MVVRHNRLGLLRLMPWPQQPSQSSNQGVCVRFAPKPPQWAQS